MTRNKFASLAQVLGLVLVVGCGTKEAYQADINQWIGQSQEALVESLGDPTEYQLFDDGAAYMAYRTYELGGLASVKTPVAIGERTCWTRFQLDAGGTVTAASFVEDSCRL